MNIGYVGIKEQARGAVKVCFACVDENKGKDWGGHSFAPVNANDTYITNNGGMTCDFCLETFI